MKFVAMDLFHEAQIRTMGRYTSFIRCHINDTEKSRECSAPVVNGIPGCTPDMEVIKLISCLSAGEISVLCHPIRLKALQNGGKGACEVWKKCCD